MKNKTSLKLSLYFGIALTMFAIIIGITFYYLFRRQTIETHKMTLSNRADIIAENTVEYLEGNHTRTGGGFGAYLRSLSNIAGANAWIIDENKNLIVGNGRRFLNGNNTLTYKDLPANAEHIIEEVFLDKTVFSEDFSGLMEEATLTVGVPIKNSNDNIIGVVLLHSSIIGINSAVRAGILLLLLSLATGLILAFLLSLWLSRNFTTPILQKEAEDAIKLDKIRKDFVANISHELKTPVTVIRGSLEALTDKVVTEPAMIEDYHQQMLKEAIHLQRLIGDLLDLSRLQNADFIMNVQEVSIFEVLSEAVRSASHIGKEKGIQIELTVDKDFNIQGDYGRIRQMLMIILDNGIKFSPEKSIIKVRLNNGSLIIQDFGNGIKKEEVPFIFERFYKARTEDNKSGTGLGLAIAKQIADRHNITISVTSLEGEGTTFRFLFP